MPTGHQEEGEPTMSTGHHDHLWVSGMCLGASARVLACIPPLCQRIWHVPEQLSLQLAADEALVPDVALRTGPTPRGQPISPAVTTRVRHRPAVLLAAPSEGFIRWVLLAGTHLQLLECCCLPILLDLRLGIGHCSRHHHLLARLWWRDGQHVPAAAAVVLSQVAQQADVRLRLQGCTNRQTCG